MHVRLFQAEKKRTKAFRTSAKSSSGGGKNLDAVFKERKLYEFLGARQKAISTLFFGLFVFG